MKKILFIITLSITILFIYSNKEITVEAYDVSNTTNESYQANAYSTSRIGSDGYLYYTGKGLPLGLNSTTNYHEWIKLDFHEPIDWEFGYAAGVIDKDGVLWVNGYNSSGSLGVGHSDGITSFQEPIGLTDAYNAGYKCVKFETGSQISLVLMEDNLKNQKIFVAGNGIGTSYVEATGFEGYIIDIEGSYGSVALNQDGDIFHINASNEFIRITSFDGRVKQIDGDTFVTGVLISTFDGLYVINQEQAISSLALNSAANDETDIIMARIGVSFHGYLTTNNILYLYENSTKTWIVVENVQYFDIARDHYIYYVNNEMVYSGTTSSDNYGQYGDGDTKNNGLLLSFNHYFSFDINSWGDEFVSAAEPLMLFDPLLRSESTKEITNSVEFTDYIILDFTDIDLLTGVNATITSTSFSNTVTIYSSSLTNNLYYNSNFYGKSVGEYTIT